MAVHSVAPWLRLPGVPRYRRAANRPDLPGPTPGNAGDSALAIRTLWPSFGAMIELVEGEISFAEFLPRVKAGRPASVSVLSGSLPAALRFGFEGTHRVAVFWTGSELRLANPLARTHSRSKPIAEEDLHAAVRDHPLSRVHAVLMPTVEEAFEVHPLRASVADDTIDGLDDGTDDTDATEDVPAG